MSETVTLQGRYINQIDEDQPDAVLVPTTYPVITAGGAVRALLSFYPLSPDYDFRPMEWAELVISTVGSGHNCMLNYLAEPFDPATVTYNTKPRHGIGYSTAKAVDGELDFRPSVYQTSGGGEFPAANAVQNGVMLTLNEDVGSMQFYGVVQAGSLAPWLELSFAAGNCYLSPSGYPAQGYINPAEANTFQWSNELAGGACLRKPDQLRATIYWQQIGSSTVHTDVVTDEQQIVYQAGTFASGSIRWRVEVLDEGGTTTSSPWYTLSTAEPLSTAVALSPKNTSIDAAAGVDFSWQHRINTGTAPTGADLQLSDDGSTWTDLAHVTGAATTYHAAPGEVLSGTHFWRVRTYNQDDAAGSWSDAATFAAIAPPPAPSVMATAEARPTVSWTAAEQQAYEIQLDSQDFGPFFGQDNSWRATTYLADGAHTARVRVQNAYGLWSDWGAWTFTVSNGTAQAITLSAQSGESPTLNWTSPQWQLSGLDMTIGKHLYTNGAITDGATRAATVGFSSVAGATRLRYAGPAQSADGRAYDVFVCFYSAPTGTNAFISPRVALAGGAWKTVPEGAAYARFGIGFPGSSGVEPMEADCANCILDLSTGYAAPDAWLVYRDGALIAQTTAQNYTDTGAAAGQHSYQVRGIYESSGSYILSNTVTAEASISGMVILDALSGTALSCPTVLEADRVIREAQSINVSFVHYAGAIWPVAEATKERDNTYACAPTWPRGQEPDLLALMGREVLVRDQYGGRCYGVIVRITPETRQTRVRYAIQIQQTAEPGVSL